MALTDEGSNGFYMPVAPAYNGGGFGNGGFGGDWGWIILLLLCGWGNGGFGGGFGGGLGYDFPWLMNGQQGINNNVSDGFRDQMIQTTVSSIGDKITSGFGDIATQLCGGFAGVNASITNAQMANMQSIFGVQSALQNCCCENRAGIADLKYTVATENCADRAALSDGIRDVLAATQAQTQTVLDKLCQLELDGYKREADHLRSQLTAANLAASQTAQTAELRTAAATIANQAIAEMRSCPIPSQPVYGNQPIFTCGGNNYGCGCNGGVA